jgi:hypothetical protein
MKRNLTAEDNPKTFALWQEAIQPIVDWCESERGRKSTLIQAVQVAAQPEKLSFNVISNWLNPEAEKRVQPMLGNGLLLLEVFRQTTHPRQ